LNTEEQYKQVIEAMYEDIKNDEEAGDAEGVDSGASDTAAARWQRARRAKTRLTEVLSLSLFLSFSLSLFLSLSLLLALTLTFSIFNFQFTIFNSQLITYIR
jgi:hypothetical protein